MAIDISDEDVWRTQPMYTIREAAHLAGVHASTARRWLRGYVPDRRFPEWRSPPVFGPKQESSTPYVSFLQLIEIVVAAEFRTDGHVKLDVVRQAHANARAEYELEYPFAHLRLESLGGHIVQWLHAGDAQALDSPTQFSIPGLVERRMQEIEYEGDLAARWYPVGKDIPIVVDPRFSAGLPTVDGRGVTVNTIYKRWKADQPINFIADDLVLEPTVVERVLRYADKIAA